MATHTNNLVRCIQTLESSLALYREAELNSIEQEVFRNAVVKGFELAQETTYKLLRRVLKEFGHGAAKLDSLPVKDMLRLAATHGLMNLEEVERWYVYRDNRNDTAHDYGVGFAKETVTLLPGFLEDVHRIEAQLRARFGGTE